ncbi:EAL domain-containing protein [Psychrosphaera sp. F3M07]|uniref:GGDEF domain-containing phosphodiesterase n=1 Tax=Psychrosphaera sp. F3M07 TaxID=2841560 RepID=UPI001C09E89B|nr:GGDEF domain-containing phosphodiesterase [Psychrosphaera sp. F3M07]MBU2917789.1 EAL domain-containing protein [Psychrosphaera sp. F3M07]
MILIFPLNKNNKWVAVLLSFSFTCQAQEQANSIFLSNKIDISFMLMLCLFAIVIAAFLLYNLIRFRRYQSDITASDERLKLSLWASGDEMWDWNIADGTLYRTNANGVYTLPSIDLDTFPPNKAVIHPADLVRVAKKLKLHLDGDSESFECAYRLKSNDNSWNWVLDKGKVVSFDEDGSPIRMTGTFKDIHQLKKIENNLKIFAQSIESIAEGVIIFDAQLSVVHVNPGYEIITGHKATEIVGTKLKFNQISMSLAQEIKSEVDRIGHWQGDVSGQNVSGGFYMAYITANCIKDEQGKITNYVAIVSDTTKRKRTEAKLVKMAKTDTLTGLPNRDVFFSNLQKQVSKKSPTAVLVFDLDDFKKINDSVGHQLGDELLKQIGDRIKPLAEDNDTLYRLGGDEFAFVMENTNDIHKVTLAAKQILTLLSTPYRINQHEFVIAGSIGIVLYPDDGLKPETLLRNADTAMYYAKADGNKYLFFNNEMNKQAVKRLQIENLIRHGLKEDYFEVYYQPKSNLKTDKLVGMEALVRFITPKKGLISPSVFIPIAEETGQIIDIGDLVLRKACIDMKRWIDNDIITGRVAVNLSARQFTLPDLIERIDTILAETGLNPTNLELEITEGTVMDNPKHAITIMHQLRERGIHLALDDFGTGYSSLSYLRKFPLNTLKIDKAFVDDCSTNIGKAMIDTIVTIARNLSLSTVAEGVETEEQKALMSSMKCDVIQGYLYSKPLSAKEFSRFANKQKA